MGLSFALGSALSGLRATQTGLELVSTNIANVNTPGYTKKNAQLATNVLADRASGVRVTGIQRDIDTYVQRQLRVEAGGLSYSNVAASFLDRVQRVFGTPNSSTSLDTLVTKFTNSLDTLATTPSSQSARQGVLNEAQILAQSLNSMSADIQAMRENADRGLASTVDAVNAALNGIDRVQEQISALSASGNVSPDLLDQRDRYVDELSQLVDIRVSDTGGDFQIYTTGGAPLFTGSAPATLTYENQVAMMPQALYSPDPEQNRAGTVMLRGSDGQPIDLLSGSYLRSGELKAYADLRDDVLVEAQTQLDEIASAMADALSTNVVQGTAPTAPATDWSIDLADLQSGNKVNFTYNQMPGGQSRTVTFVRVESADTLPLSNDLTADPNDTVVGIDFSGGPAAVQAQMQAALGANFAVSGAGSSITIDTANPAAVVPTGLSARVTATGFMDGLGIPFFVDGAEAFTDSQEGLTQRLGFAARIQVNPALIEDPAMLVNYQASMASGDASRVVHLRNALENTSITYRNDTGLGGTTSPFTGSIADFARGVIEKQASNAALASRIQEGQEVVVTSLLDRYAEKSAVDVDEEMSKLLQLQTAYSANARVISTVKEMMDILMQM